MRLTICFVCFALTFFHAPKFLGQETHNSTATAIGLATGYTLGFGGQTNATCYIPVPSLAASFGVGIGYTSLDPRSATNVGRIFINNITIGVPESKAKSFDYRSDILWPIALVSSAKSYVHFGPRYSSYSPSFKYVAGNDTNYSPDKAINQPQIMPRLMVSINYHL